MTGCHGLFHGRFHELAGRDGSGAHNVVCSE